MPKECCLSPPGLSEAPVMSAAVQLREWLVGHQDIEQRFEGMLVEVDLRKLLLWACEVLGVDRRSSCTCDESVMVEAPIQVLQNIEGLQNLLLAERFEHVVDDVSKV